MRVLGALTVSIAIAWTAVAGTHPVHEVVQNAYLTLAPGSVELELDLTAGPEVAGRIVRALDVNADRRVGSVEARAYAVRVLTSSHLVMDGHPLALRLQAIDVPPYPALLGAHGTIRIVAVAARGQHSGRSTLAYRNGYRPAESRCDVNVFLKVPGKIAAQRRSNDGRALAVELDLR